MIATSLGAATGSVGGCSGGLFASIVEGASGRNGEVSGQKEGAASPFSVFTEVGGRPPVVGQRAIIDTIGAIHECFVSHYFIG